MLQMDDTRVQPDVVSQMSTTVKTVIEGERFLHKELWQVVARQLDRGKSNPHGAFYDDLVAMVFALHAFEAYLNYVGGHLAPEIWKDERKYFRQGGFASKVRKVLELAGVSEPTLDSRPYATIWFLKEVRDLIVHAKPVAIAFTQEHDRDTAPNLLDTSLDALITRANAERAYDDIGAFAAIIHAAARLKVDDIWFGSVPFGGAIQYGSGATTIAR